MFRFASCYCGFIDFLNPAVVRRSNFATFYGGFIDILKYVNFVVFRFASFSYGFIDMFESGGHPAAIRRSKSIEI